MHWPLAAIALYVVAVALCVVVVVVERGPIVPVVVRRPMIVGRAMHVPMSLLRLALDMVHICAMAIL